MEPFVPGAHVPTSAQRAAGTVVVRRTDEGLQAALIHRPHRSDWSLPKGKLEPDESFEEAAVRETVEETGLTVRLIELLGTSEYEHRSGNVKVVAFYLAEFESGTFIANAEADDLRWCAVEEAAVLATFARDAELVRIGIRRAAELGG